MCVCIYVWLTDLVEPTNKSHAATIVEVLYGMYVL